METKTLTEIKAQLEQRKIEQKQAELDTKEKELQNEAYRQHVVFQELGSREAEAVWKKYHFTILADGLRETYEQVMQKNYEILKQKQSEFEELKQNAVNNTMLMAGAVPE